ncbi:type II toxin-antitoxin system RelB/DinJ family antitoxin [Asticcacaulis sp.]|uniref:type II toxin-antitoxin system RelB/DinJ family antitoxin n=1 Tax=unclassified Asticcacaulis TaxID=2628350 RepID=UPI0025C2F1AA|nr:type II toxin-antitoxin system RelB/DinJ family antitoxin [Asticcacaulis sp.]MCA1934562.1 type II toxin-antitoxin system RelB/DinJ family antitoxin [Asticcacaulis sp.]
MAASEVVQARIDGAIKERAGAVLSQMGLTVSDAVRILLTRIANEGALPAGLTVDPQSYDVWLRDKVREAMHDPRPPVSHADAHARMADIKAQVLAGRDAKGQ